MTDVRIITEPLGGSPLSRRLQEGSAPDTWLLPPPRSPDEWRARADQRRAEGGWSARWAALGPALAASGVAAARLDRVRQAEGIVVTTGQQPGLFGGPIYTWSKAMGALALADEIERATGIPTAAIFWAATDDADFAEAATTLVARGSETRTLRATASPPAGTPMSLAPLGDLGVAMDGLLAASASAADPRPLEAARAAYGTSSSTVGNAYVRLLRALLEPLGVAVLDASHVAVHTASEHMLTLARQRAPALARSLAARAAELRAAGFEPQVDDVDGLSLVFVREDGVKRRLGVDEAGVSRDGWYTPNVLLRPVVEATILPTVAYLAGPGEIAYFAQTSAVASALGAAQPVALPRWSCTLVEPHISRLLARYGASVPDLAAPDLLETRLARAVMSDGAAAVLARVRETISSLPDDLGGEASPLGLGAAVQGATQSLLHRLDRLERRLVARIKWRETDQMRDVATLRAALFPRGGRQERGLNLLPILARNGMELLGEMRDAAGAHAAMLVRPSHGAGSDRAAP